MGTEKSMAFGEARSYVDNFVPVINSPGLSAKSTAKLRQRKGFSQSIVNAAAGYKITAGLQWTGLPGTGTIPDTSRGVLVYAANKSATDTKLYKWNTSETTLGTFATADYQCIQIAETLISGVANLTIALRNTASPYDQKLLFFPNAGALTEVTDGDFPASTFIGQVAHIDGYCVFAAGGNLWNFDVNSLSSVTATSFIAVQMVPDNLVGVVRAKNIVWAIGTQSIEPFQNVGSSTGSPFQRIANGVLNIGVLHGRAIQQIGEDFVFISISTGRISVHMLSGSQVKPISRDYIDTILREYAMDASNSPIRGGTMASSNTYACGVTALCGVEFAIFIIAGQRLGYAPSLDRWIILNIPSGATDAFFLSLGGQPVGCDSGSSTTGGKIAYVKDDNNSSTDFGSAGTAKFQTVAFTHGTPKRKFAKSIEAICDISPTGGVLRVSYSDDDGATFTDWGDLDLTANPPQKLTRGGAYRKRIYKGSTIASTGIATIIGLAETFDVGTS